MYAIYVTFFLLVLLGSYLANELIFLTVPAILYLFYYKEKKILSIALTGMLVVVSIAINIIANKKIDYILLGTYVLVLFTLIYFIKSFFKSKDLKIKQLHRQALSTEGNTLLRKILKLAITSKEGTIAETTEKICEALIEYYKLDYCTLLLYEQRGFSIVSSNVEEKYRSYIELYANRCLEEMELGSAKILSCENDYLQYPTAAQRGIKYCYLIHLNTDKLLGALLIENRESTLLDNIEEDFFEIVKENIAIVLQNLINNDKLVTAAMVDGLTQVWNRIYMEKRLKEEIQNHIVSGAHFSISVLDVDHFKKFNDTYGHIHGDKVLKEISKFIASKIRVNIDFIARYGGEEFVIFFRKTSNKDIFEKLDRIREEIALLEISNEQGVVTPVTASFGLAEFPKHGHTIEELIEAADKALYYSKQNGRNRVTCYDEIKKSMV